LFRIEPGSFLHPNRIPDVTFPKISASRACALAFVLFAASFAGCAGPPGGARALPEPSAAPIVALRSERPLVALALGSGGSRGFAHVGVIKALEAAGIQVDIVVGSSAGAIVAALYAAGYPAARLEAIAVNLEESDLVDVSLTDGLRIRGERLAEFVTTSLDHRPMERLARAFAVVATDAETGAGTVFNRGNPGTAVRASASVPRMFIPPVIGGREYLDGGLSSPVPVKVARAMGADVVIAVDISRLGASAPASAAVPPPPGAPVPASSPGTRGSRRELLESELAQADVVIRPDVPRTRILDFQRKLESIAAGEEAARTILPRLNAVLAAAQRAKRAQPAPDPGRDGGSAQEATVAGGG